MTISHCAAQALAVLPKGHTVRLAAEFADKPPAPDVLPTGSIGLDAATGIGGYPRGRLVEVYGPESCGKTTLLLHAVAEAQRLGQVAAFVDAEHSLDLRYAHALGVRLPELLLCWPRTEEEALDTLIDLVRSGRVGLVALDSVAALSPQTEQENDFASGGTLMGESTHDYELQARLLSVALRQLVSAAGASGTLVMVTNQLREKGGVVFGSPETTTGGNALKYYASVRLDVRRTGQVKQGDEVIGSRTKVKVVKNKMAPPFREAEFEILFGVGLNRAGELLDRAVDTGLVTIEGGIYQRHGVSLGKSRTQAALALGRLAGAAALRDRVLGHLLSRPADASAAGA